MAAPRYQDIAADAIPVVDAGNGARIKVIAGRYGTTEGPVQAVATEPLYLDVHLTGDAATAIDIPKDHAAFAYVYEGGVRLPAAGRQLARGELAVLGTGDRLTVAAANGPARLIVVAGRPLRERVVKYGPFVMTSEAEIIQAIEDYQAGRF